MSAPDSAPIQKSTRQAFERLAEPLRSEIKVHCYRMLGSIHQAEDSVQESYLRAWRAFDTFSGGSFTGGSFRAWMYKIATNACLNAIEARKVVERLLPNQLGPSTTRMPDAVPPTDIAWLEPYPDSLLDGAIGNTSTPEARFATRESVQLAFVALVQQLPPRQRATLLLCDVLGWTSAEAATAFGTSTASINSALQRGRETLSKRYPERRPSRASGDQRELLQRYVSAWEKHDVSGFVALLSEDASFTMPPWLQWYVGREVIGSFFTEAWKTCGGLRLVETAANGQPALAVYEYEHSASGERFVAHAIHVLTVEQDVIIGITAFQPPNGPELFRFFGLPQIL
jgi:RNA polymerase sigma-70 factor (ECF subfamily)